MTTPNPSGNGKRGYQKQGLTQTKQTIRDRTAVALTGKQQRFVEEYLVDLNATQAATRAGYSKATAYSIGHECLKKPEIAAAITRAQAERSE